MSNASTRQPNRHCLLNLSGEREQSNFFGNPATLAIGNNWNPMHESFKGKWQGGTSRTCSCAENQERKQGRMKSIDSPNQKIADDGVSCNPRIQWGWGKMQMLQQTMTSLQLETDPGMRGGRLRIYSAKPNPAAELQNQEVALQACSCNLLCVCTQLACAASSIPQGI